MNDDVVKDQRLQTCESSQLKSSLSRRAFLHNSMAAGVIGIPGIHQNAVANLLAITQSSDKSSTLSEFREAVPVWPEGRDKEMNLFVGFVSEISYDTGSAFLLLAASTLYRVHVNGQFCACGPARGPHGYYRLDSLDVTPHLHQGANTVVVEVAGYNINSYWTLNQPSFLQAEILCGDKVFAATGGAKPFRATILTQRLQKVGRYSFQRAFMEAYRLTPPSAQWREGKWAAAQEQKCEISVKKLLLPRRAPYPAYELRRPVKHVAYGTMERAPADTPIRRPRFVASIGPKLLGFKESELEVSPYIELQRYENVKSTTINDSYQPADSAHFSVGGFHTYDFGTNLAGFPGALVTVTKTAKLYVTFDEMLTDGDVDFKRLACANIVYYELAPGTYELESFEPYTVRFLKLIAIEGEFEVRSIFLRTYESSDGLRASFFCSDNGLNRLFLSGRETYRQNAVDLFTDCPSRERAGWLCDSYFTSRASQRLTGNSNMEMAFLENYLLSRKFDSLPDGMLPMCYPADHYDGQYIANWPMWLVLELEEYLERSGDRTMVDRFKNRILELMQCFHEFQNEDGLLENLSGNLSRHMYVEEGDANKYIRGVNYPTNMLYAAMLESIGRLYNSHEYLEIAEGLREKIRHQAYDGRFFVDNALRQNGVLQATQNRTEICQYYAFYFGTVSTKSHPELWKRLCEEFGPARSAKQLYPEISPTDALNGRILRLELLSQEKRIEQMLREAKDYLLYMADSSGTLWEHNEDKWSLCHAFQSHIVHELYRDALGLCRVDTVGKQIELCFAETGLDWCEGSVPTPHGEITLQWKRVGQQIQYHCKAPVGYSIRATSSNGLRLQKTADALKAPSAAT
jgi:alpha-L-rhamnosidase